MDEQDSEVTIKYLEESIKMIDSHIRPNHTEYAFWKRKQKELIERYDKMLVDGLEKNG